MIYKKNFKEELCKKYGCDDDKEVMIAEKVKKAWKKADHVKIFKELKASSFKIKVDGKLVSIWGYVVYSLKDDMVFVVSHKKDDVIPGYIYLYYLTPDCELADEEIFREMCLDILEWVGDID